MSMFWSNPQRVVAPSTRDVEYLILLPRGAISAKRGIAITCRLSVRPSVCNVGGL